MSVVISKNGKRLLLCFAVVIAALIGLSSWYYKSLVLDPVEVWHGANLGVRTLVGGGGNARYDLSHDKAMLERLSKAKNSEVNYKAISIESSLDVHASHMQLKNQIAANAALQTQIEKDVGRLTKTNEQILNSKKTLDGLNQDFSAMAAYQQIELARQQMIQDALDIDREVPSEADANALIAQRGRSNSSVGASIPEKVLNNVQQTTGISPEEINKLMNE